MIDIAQLNVNIKIDENDMKKFELFCYEAGMNVSVAINMFIKTVLREHKLPFEIRADLFCSESNIKYLEKIVSDMNIGKSKVEERRVINEDDG